MTARERQALGSRRARARILREAIDEARAFGEGLAAELDGAGPQRELENARLGLEVARQWIDVVEDRLEREELAE